MNRLFLPVSAALAAIAWWAFSWQALLSLHKRWWTWGETYEIGYPLLAIAIYWGFAQRARLQRSASQPSWLGGVLFVATLLLSSAARLVQLQIIQQLMVPVSLWCGLFAVFGWRRAALLALPCALLLGGVPVWDFLVDPLRMLTVLAVQGLLSLLKIPALVQGYHVVLPGGLIKIEDACSGLNLLLAALVLSVLQAEVSLAHSWRKYLVVLLGIAIGVIDNWLRVFGLVAIAYYSDMKSPLVHDHISFGWWLFVISLVPFFFIARIIERGAARPNTGADFAGRSGFATAVGSTDWSFANSSSRDSAASTLALAAIALLCGGLYLLSGHIESRADATAPQLASPPAAQPQSDGWLPRYSGYAAAQTWRRTVNDRSYEIAALLYRQQQPGKKLIYYANRIADPENIETSASLRLADGKKINTTIVHQRQWRAVWWYYWIDGTVATSVWRVKLLQLRALLFGEPSAALVTLSVVCREPGCEGELTAPAATGLAAELLNDFAVVSAE